MPSLRALPKPGRSTVVLLGGLAVGLIGAALGGKSPTPAAPAHPLAVVACHPTSVVAFPATADNTGAPDSLAEGLGLESGDPARVLEALAARDSARALALAFSLAGGDPLLRQHLLDAVLRGWAQVAPEAATDWCLRRPFAERAADAAAVLAGAVTDTDQVLRLASRFVRDDPALAHDHGCSLVYALAQAGEFGLAARFAATGPDANREAWVRTAFTVWAEHQPERAMAAVAGLSTPQLRAEAFEAAVAGWAATDPAGLAKSATLQAAEADRLYALHSAFSEWVSRDLIGASEWLSGRPPGAEFDVGAAAIATAGPLVTLCPELALNWAETVTDAGLRSGTIAGIVQEWAKNAPVEAYHYAETSSDLLATDRTTVLADLTATPGP